MKTYLWEIVPMEGASIFVETTSDSVAAAAVLYEEQYNNFQSVYAIRKASETQVYKEAI